MIGDEYVAHILKILPNTALISAHKPKQPSLKVKDVCEQIASSASRIHLRRDDESDLLQTDGRIGYFKLKGLEYITYFHHNRTKIGKSCFGLTQSTKET